jgi:hypothetical protein
MTELVVDPDRHLFARFRHHQRQMQAEHAVVGSAMRGDVLARREDGEKRRLHPWDLFQRRHRRGTLPAVLLAPRTVAAENEGLPVVVGLDRLHLARDVLEVRQLVAALHHLVQLGADRGPVGLDCGGPRKILAGIDGTIPDAGKLGQAPFGAVEKLCDRLAGEACGRFERFAFDFAASHGKSGEQTAVAVKITGGGLESSGRC